MKYVYVIYRIILDFVGMKQMNRAEAQPHMPESETSYFHLFYEALHLFVYYRKISGLQNFRNVTLKNKERYMFNENT